MPSAASNKAEGAAAMQRDPSFYQRRDVGASISTGFHYIRTHGAALYRPLLFMTMPLVMVGSLLLGSFFHAVGPGRQQASASPWLMVGGYVLLACAYILSSVIICEFMRWTMLNGGRAPSMGPLWKEVRRRFWAYLGISLLTGMMMAVGFVLFVLPLIFLFVTFPFSYPLHAFERASVGDCIGRAFSLVLGRWWLTFGLLVLLFGMSLLLNGAIDVPIWMLTTFASLSGVDWTEDPDGSSTRFRLFMTLLSLVSNTTYLIIAPFVQVPMAFHMLATTEAKESPGLLEEVRRLDLSLPDQPTTRA